MPLVTVRDARPGDARAVAAVWAAAAPHLVRSSAQAAADLRTDAAVGRRRWVASVGGAVVGTASSAPAAGDALVTVDVDPSHGSRGVGSALLSEVVAASDRVHHLRAVAGADPVALSFAVRAGFLPEAELLVSATTRRVPLPAGPAPGGLRPVTLESLRDTGELVDWWNTAAVDDPSGLFRPVTADTLTRLRWAGPDHAPELSWGLVEPQAGSHRASPRVVGLCTARVDRERTRAALEVTAVRPSYRRRGVGGWVVRRTLEALAEAGLEEVLLHHDPTSPAAATLAGRLETRAVARSAVVVRRVQR